MKIMNDTNDSKRNDEKNMNPFERRKRMLLASASAAIVIGAIVLALNWSSIQNMSNKVIENSKNSTTISADTEDSDNTNSTDIQSPADAASGSQLAEGEEVTGTDGTVNSPISLTLEPKTYPVGTKSLTIKIKNQSDAEISYGVDYSIEQLIGGDAWAVVPASQNLMFIEIAQILKSNTEADFVVDLSQLDPILEEGTYRIVKNINGEVFHAEFTLTK